MKLSVSDLQSNVAKVLAGTVNNSAIEGAEYLYFTGNQISTYNDKIAVSIPFKTDFECAVNATDFHNVIKKLSEESCTIEFKDTVLEITTESTTAELACNIQDTVISKILSAMYANQFTFAKAPDDFIDGISSCLFSISKFASSRILSCIAVDGSLINSTDDVRVSEFVMNGEFSCPLFLLPNQIVRELISFGKETTLSYATTDNWIHFKNEDGAIFSCQLIIDEYPNPDHLFEFEGHNITLPPSIIEAIDAVSYLADDSMRNFTWVKLNITPGEITVVGQRERGKMTKKVPFTYDGEPLEFEASPTFLLDVLSKTLTIKVGEKTALFVANNFRHVMALKV